MAEVSCRSGTERSRRFRNCLQAVMPSLWGMLCLPLYVMPSSLCMLCFPRYAFLLCLPREGCAYITSLYTNIPHEEVITACEDFLNLWDLSVPSTADLCHLIQLILQWIPSCLMRNTSYKCKEQLHVWVPGCHLPMPIYSWESWNVSSCNPGYWTSSVVEVHR